MGSWCLLRASGIGARCAFERAAVFVFQAFLAQLPAKGPLRSTQYFPGSMGRLALTQLVLLMQHPLRGCFRACPVPMPFSLAHFVRSLLVSVSLWSGISPRLRSCSLKRKNSLLSGFSLGKEGLATAAKVAPFALLHRSVSWLAALCALVVQSPGLVRVCLSCLSALSVCCLLHHLVPTLSAA